MGIFPLPKPLSALAVAVSLLFAARAQNAPPKQAYNKVIGAVVSVDPNGKKLTVKEDNGTSTEVLLDADTSFMLVPPGEKDLSKATRVDLKDVGPGDRIYARTRKIDGQDQTPATSVIVMSRKQVAQHQEQTRDEWQRRGVAGKVAAVDPATKTITISTSGGAKSVTVQTDDQTRFKRYAPDSIKFADAKPSKLGDIDIGNNLRVLGNKSADGESIHAEEVLSGSFRTIAGTVISVDAAANEIKVNDLATKKPVTIKVNEDTKMHKLPPEMAMMIARMRGGAGAPGAAGGASNGSGTVSASNPVVPKGQGGPDSHPGFNGPGAGSASASTGGSGAWAGPGGQRGAWGGSAGGQGRGRADINQILERTPTIALADLKAGDALVISSTNGADSSRGTAVTVIAGVEPILAAAPAGSRQSGAGASAAGGSWTLDMAMPE